MNSYRNDYNRPQRIQNRYSDFSPDNSQPYTQQPDYLNDRHASDFMNQKNHYNNDQGDQYGRPRHAPNNGYDDRVDYGYPTPANRPRDYGYTRDGYRTDMNTASGPKRAGSGGDKIELDHLATFTVGQSNGLVNPEDGIRKLKQMEVTDGIWTMRCTMDIQTQRIVIIDTQTNREIEFFPLELITEPCAMMTPPHIRNLYNNIVLFIVEESPNLSEMHIFQCISRSADEVAEEIIRAKSSHRRAPAPPPQAPPQDTGYNYPEINKSTSYEQYYAKAAHDYGGGRRRTDEAFKQAISDADSILSESTNIDVQVLNQTFDDIEKFVSRLQASAEAYRELERRRQSRKRNKYSQGDGMLSMRARPPAAKDFMDILQKFKLSFNLLAKLKAHIHDPNAPELVHFLFTPLSLIVEASKDPHNGTPDLPSKVYSPLLSTDAKELLKNCLTTKETELWITLGEAWITSKEEWRRPPLPLYVPQFYSGAQFPGYVFDEWSSNKPLEPRPSQNSRPPQTDYYPPNNVPADYPRHNTTDYQRQPPPTRYRRPNVNEYDRQNYSSYSSNEGDNHIREYDNDNPKPYRSYEPSPSRQIANPPSPRAARHNDHYKPEWKKPLPTNGMMCEATASRQSNHSKELTVEMGEQFEILDKTKNWWKLRNRDGEVGHAPYTILKEINPHDLMGREVTVDYSPERRQHWSPRSSPQAFNVSSPKHKPSSPPPPPMLPTQNRREQNDIKRAKAEDNERLSSVDSNPPSSTSSIISNSGPNFQDLLQDELRTRVAMGPQTLKRVKSRKVQPFTIDYSADQMKQWLQEKGFSERAQLALENITGEEMLNMPRHRLDLLLKDESSRMASQIELTKNVHSYNTQPSTQLTQIMSFMKAKSGYE